MIHNNSFKNINMTQIKTSAKLWHILTPKLIEWYEVWLVPEEKIPKKKKKNDDIMASLK